jgi:hypothetical protein
MHGVIGPAIYVLLLMSGAIFTRVGERLRSSESHATAIPRPNPRRLPRPLCSLKLTYNTLFILLCLLNVDPP